MRKVLYSSGYGAGWSSWIGNTTEERRFCCEYQPFIEYLEKHEEMPSDTTLLGEQFLADWRARFPDADPDPYLGGIRDLQVEEVPDREQYMIKEYDGSERVITRSAIEDEWM
jgi:hypothetical protein